MRYRLTIAFLVFAALITSPTWAATSPVTDSFSGSGALSSNWTNTTETSDFTGTLVQSSGQAVPSPSGTGFTNNQYAQAKVLANPASSIWAESDLDGFNFKPASDSPAIGAGVAIPRLTTDYTGATRPNPPSIGAIE